MKTDSKRLGQAFIFAMAFGLLALLAPRGVKAQTVEWDTLVLIDFEDPAVMNGGWANHYFGQYGLSYSSEFGASGQNDACIRGGHWINRGISMRHQLEADEVYRLSVNAKCSHTGHKLKFVYVESSQTPIGAPAFMSGVEILQISAFQPGADLVSVSFSPPSSGQYTLYIGTDPHPFGGQIFLDNFSLQRQAAVGGPSGFTLYEAGGSPPLDTLHLSPGASATVCGSFSVPGSSETVDIELQGNSAPHFVGYGGNSLSFPADTVTEQCFTLQAASGLYSQTYTFNARRADGALLASFVTSVATSAPCGSVAGADQAIEAGDSVQLGTGCLPAPHPYYGRAYAYSWLPAGSLSDASVAQPWASPAGTTTYLVQVSEGGNTVAVDTVQVTVQGGPPDTTGTGPPPDTLQGGGGPPPGAVPADLAIKLSTASDGSRVLLRWAPLNYNSWDWARQHGYRLERKLFVQSDTIVLGQPFVVLDSTLAPLPEPDWAPLADDSEAAGLAASALYSPDFSITGLPADSDIFQAFNLVREKDNRFGFSLFAADQSFEVAKAMGIAYTDSTAEAGKAYLYRVRFNELPEGSTMGRAVTDGRLSDTLDLPPPAGVFAQPADGQARIEWSWQGMEPYYSSFKVERSDDGGATFAKVNLSPIVYTAQPGTSPLPVLLFQDSLPDNGPLYIYRVIGHSPFGLDGPPSDTVHVRGKPDPMGIRPFVHKVQEISGGRLNVQWQFAPPHRDDIDGFNVLRGRTVDGPFEQINTALVSKHARSFVDDDPMPANYYRVVALDANGYELTSFSALGQLNDEVPPAPPAAPACVANQSGLVLITWPANTEPDLMGYRVYTANQLEGEYMELTRTWIRDTFYRHSINLNTLAKEAYYKIVALDLRHNASDWSEAGILQIPDIVPPAPPSLSQVEPRLGYVALAWQGSTSNDLARHEVQRKKSTGYVWSTLAVMDLGEELSHSDSTASPDYDYDYRVLAVDGAGLRSSSQIVRARPLSSAVRGEIRNFWAVIHQILPDTTGSSTWPVISVTGQPMTGLNAPPRPGQPGQRYLVGAGEAALVWEFDDQPGLYGFQIYRAARDGVMRPHRMVMPDRAAVDPAVLQQLQAAFGANYPRFTPSMLNGDYYHFVDQDLSAGVPYRYQVQAEFLDGAFSPMSNQVIVVY